MAKKKVQTKDDVQTIDIVEEKAEEVVAIETVEDLKADEAPIVENKTVVDTDEKDTTEKKEDVKKPIKKQQKPQEVKEKKPVKPVAKLISVELPVDVSLENRFSKIFDSHGFKVEKDDNKLVIKVKEIDNKLRFAFRCCGFKEP